MLRYTNDDIENWEEYGQKIVGTHIELNKSFYERLKSCESISLAPLYEENEEKNLFYSEDGKWIRILLKTEKEWDWKEFYQYADQMRCLFVDHFAELPDEITKMRDLRSLELRGCNPENILEKIGNLRDLENLNLNQAELSELPEEIGKLSNLRELHLMDTGISSFPKSIANLKSLQYLGMNETKIREIPEEIFELEELRSLYLGRTEISILPEGLKKLKKLEHLAIWETQLQELPDWICEFTELKGLYLGRTKGIQRLPEEIGNLKKLEKLYLDGTSLTRLPDSFGELKNLKKFSIKNTKIRKFPKLSPFSNLTRCDLGKMTLERIPVEFANTFGEISTQEEYSENGLSLYQTKLLCQPISLFEQKRELIDAYYEEEKIHLNETKVVFLGDGEAGKSHIIERMKQQGEKISQFCEQATPGIKISQEHYQIESEEVCLQIWDFGGQEIMHSMHRFFLTDRTLYVIVLNSRDNTQDERAKYWLNNIKSFANGCPVILVLNKMDQNPSASLNERLLMNDYPQIVTTLKMSALEDEKRKFHELTEQILSTVKEFDSYAMEFPVSWSRVKNILSGMRGNYIKDKEYRSICEENGVKNTRIQNWLLDWFHDLGVSFNYRKKDELLGAYMVLKPQWITNAIYIILFNGSDEAKNGMILIHKIVELLKNPPRSVEKIQYDIEEMPYILGVMRRFEISYQIDEQTEFIPMMCDKNQYRDVEEFFEEESLEYFMEYEYLPNNVLHKLMIKMRDDLAMEKVWLTGMILSSFDGRVSALVRMHDKKIEIFIKSSDIAVNPPKEYLAEIRRNLLRINQDLNLEARDMIVYKMGGSKDEIEYEDLIIRLSSGETEYFSSAFRERISIKKILGLVEDTFDIERILRICQEHRDVTYPMLREMLQDRGFNQNEFLEDLTIICTMLQGNTLLLQKGKENDRNTYLRDLLEMRKNMVLDQTLNGKSPGEKQAGELDLLIKDRNHRPAAIIEALNLKSLDKKYLGNHIQKIYGYDTWGLICNYLVVYAECADFPGFCRRYQTFVENFTYPYPLESMEEELTTYTDMKILRTRLQRNGKLTDLLHLLVKMK
ncbi:MAG: GTP-binding protein [Lachnospiraceae bacterium]|nr:GTP-binding protein [Lachnospiraceae bacterium]